MRKSGWTTYLTCVAAASAWLLCAAAQGQPFGGRQRGPMPSDAAGPPEPVKGEPAGLHIPQGKTINFEYNMTDGGGSVWNLQPYGCVGSGNNNAYSGGMYLHINGNNVVARGQGWSNEAGDEVEIGPMPGRVVAGLQIYRRIKVYKDASLARWVDIFQNTSSQPVTFSARIYTNFNWQMGRMITNSGGATFGEKDWAMVTETGAGQGNNIPSTMHIVGDKKSKLRPRVMAQNNTLTYDYTLTVPAGGTTLLCHFESQNQSVDALTKDMQDFKAAKYLKDLSSRARSLIANFPGGGGPGEVELERSESADTVILAEEDPIYGTVQNESYSLQTLLGALTLPAEKVVGMASSPGEEDAVRFVLTDGEVISGRSPGTKITLGLPSGGQLEIPLAKIKSWSYRISKKRPDEFAATGPAVMLRTGDQLAFDPQGTKLTLRTRYGPVDLKADELLEVVLDNPANGVHRAVFLNGSHLAGLLEPDKIALTLKLGQKLEVPRDMITRVRFAAEEKADDGLCQAVLSNEDELWGTLLDANLTLTTQYGAVDLQPNSIKTFSFTASQPGRVAVVLWDGSVLRGQLKQEELEYRLQPGPTLKLPVAQIVSIARSKILPPDDIRKKVEKAVGMLGAESFKDRQTATDDLIKMGPAIVPLLQKYLSDGDPEVRQRLGEVMEKLGSKGAPPPAPSGRNFPGLQ
jgi:hypothetical protein